MPAAIFCLAITNTEKVTQSVKNKLRPSPTIPAARLTEIKNVIISSDDSLNCHRFGWSSSILLFYAGGGLINMNQPSCKVATIANTNATAKRSDSHRRARYNAPPSMNVNERVTMPVR